MGAAAVKAHELLPDGGEARLPGALDHEAADDVVGDDRLDHVAPHHPHQRLVVHVAHLHHYVPLRTPSIRPTSPFCSGTASVEVKGTLLGGGVGLTRRPGRP